VLSHFLIGYFIDRLTFGEVKHFSSALLLIITLGLLNNFGNLGLKYKSATGKYSFTVYFETFSVFVGIALTLIVLSIKPNLLTLVIGLVGVPTLMSLVHLCSIMRGFEFRAEVASLFYNKKLELNRYIIQGRLFLVLQITTVISLQIDSLIIGSILGPNEVASVSIIWKLFSVPYLLLVSATGGLWSLASSLSGQEKETIIQNIMWKNIKYTFAYSVFFGIVFFILGKKLVHLFVPDLPVPSQSFLLISILLLVSMCVAQPIAMILNGLHKEKFLITASVTGMLVNFISSVFFVNKFHEGFGALLGTAVAQIFCFVIPALLIYKPWLKGKGTI
jgi:O-antigen/teichoic acid export membrane protein